MIKKLNGYFLRKNVRHKYLIKVRSFSGPKASCIVDQVKGTLRDEKQTTLFYTQRQMISVPRKQQAKLQNLSCTSQHH